MANELLPVFLEDLDYVYDECDYIDTNTNIFWAYDLMDQYNFKQMEYYDGINDLDNANYYRDQSDFFSNKASFYYKESEQFTCYG